MGGKSDTVAPPPVVDPGPGVDMTMMMGLFQQMMANQSAQMAPPAIPDAPEVTADPVIDWTEKQKELANKVRADYEDDASRKRGRASTILTSPLLDEQLDRTESLLS